MQSSCTILHCHLWHDRLYHILPHYLINGTIFAKKKITVHKMCVFQLLHRLVRKIFHSKKDSARYYHKRILVFMYSSHYSYQILRIFELTWKIFCQWEPFFPCGRTDMTKVIVAFRNFAKVSKNVWETEIIEHWAIFTFQWKLRY